MRRGRFWSCDRGNCGVKEVIERSAIGVLGSGTGLALAGTDQVLSVVASAFTVIFMSLSILKILKEIRDKK